MVKNIDFKINCILNLMRTNYALSGDEIDLYALVDPKLSTAENWFNLKEKVIFLSPKKHKGMW